MAKKLRASYALRPETLIQMLHHAYAMGFISAVCGADDTDEDPIPMDKGGPRTELWVKQQADALLRMRRRRDGTYYLPASRNTPNAPLIGGDSPPHRADGYRAGTQTGGEE